MSTASAKQSTRDRVSAGGRVVRVILSPDAAKALDSLARAGGDTMTGAIERALLDRRDEFMRIPGSAAAVITPGVSAP